PIDDATLEQWADEGRLDPDDLVWHDGMSQWAPARTVPGIVAGVSPPPSGGSQRSSGLTALAVVNLVFGGIGVLNVFVTPWTFRMMKHRSHGPFMDKPPEAYLHVSSVSGFVVAVLLIVAGVGYLKQARWGRAMGNAYGVVAILSALIALATWPNVFVAFGTVVGLVYPVLTLILLNTTFRKQFP
ncbi:MAG: DUF4339 domain-containing protein, partial [Phycisphaerae bacterium]|nr:DUF4339 domain-containing protein [Phycisphaerae bacterium]